MDWCKCMEPRPPVEAWKDLFGRELIDGKRRYLLALDLDTANELVLANAECERARDAIAARRRMGDRDRERLRIAVHDALSDEYVMDWVG